MNTYDTEELTHHGILGQRWGIRRYQNADGSLTPAGKRKAAKMKEQYTELTGKKLIRKPTKKVETKKTNTENKSIKNMSLDELKAKINRLQLEKQAISLEQDLSPMGQKVVRSVGKDVLAPAAIDAGKRLLTDLFVKVGKDKLGLNPSQTKDALSELKRDTEFAELKKRKYAAERDYNNMIKKQNESSKSETKNENTSNSKSENKKTEKSEKVKNEKVKAEYVKPNKTVEPFTNAERKKEPIIKEAVYTESSNSTSLVPYQAVGKSLIDELFKK